jgi:hypothetical protein
VNTSRIMSVLSTLVASVLLANAAHAAVLQTDVVNVDFNTTLPSPIYSGSAAGPVAGTYWNPIALGAKNGGLHTFGPTSTLLTSDGTTGSNITISLSTINQYYTDENAVSPANGGDLLNDYAYNTGYTLTISGVTVGAKYDLYVYSQNGNYKTGSNAFSINGGAAAAVNNANIGAGQFTVNGNYVVFNGLIGPANQTFTVTETGTSGALNGFQLVLLPEPSSAILLALTALPLLRRRRRTI